MCFSSFPTCANDQIIRFSSKSSESGWESWFLGPGGQKRRFLEGQRNAIYNRYLTRSIADGFGCKIAFFKNRQFLGFWEHFWYSQDPCISRISRLTQYFNSHLRTKIASTFDEGSIESAIFRAFRGALNEGATYFRLESNVCQQCGLRFVTTVN